MSIPIKKTKWQLTYEGIMAVLALVSVSFIWGDQSIPLVRNLDVLIWIIFVIDVAVRFVLAPSKWTYIKRNPLDLIAIIPFDSIFRLARLARLFRLLRLLMVFKHYFTPLHGVLKTNSLDKVLMAVVILIFVASIPIRLIEPSIDSYSDAVWWAVVTATTVGYGDISPETMIGRLIAMVLMMFGIGLLGVVTSSVASYFLNGEKPVEEKKQPVSPTVAYLQAEVARVDELTDDEIERLQIMLESYKKQKESI
ncbi:potassium channel family protein [Paenalkalicoccus suaedae]|uniref:Potassium channel family protein n=1 Tax=Paenalkalicoccus suaedae TaxID=2592382 RepID=A0A859FC19_9BACI|nr:potassium channel family protein [Paenalkalicoccus suaedae]QKS69776.1 potassium channel family protein [Paenalkalicoccus suaedae]